MKVLRLYDHLGKLELEFNIYVEGKDFKWESSYPTPIWLGTIALEEAGKEPEAEPTPEPREVEEIIEDIKVTVERVEKALPKPEEPEPEVITREVEHEPKKVHRKRGRVKGTHPSDYLKSVKVIREEDSGRDSNQGD